MNVLLVTTVLLSSLASPRVAQEDCNRDCVQILTAAVEWATDVIDRNVRYYPARLPERIAINIEMLKEEYDWDNWDKREQLLSTLRNTEPRTIRLKYSSHLIESGLQGIARDNGLEVVIRSEDDNYFKSCIDTGGCREDTGRSYITPVALGCVSADECMLNLRIHILLLNQKVSLNQDFFMSTELILKKVDGKWTVAGRGFTTIT